MQLTKLNDNLNIHQSLPDNPTLTADELKKKFDEGVNIIKKYLNDLFIPELESSVSTEIEDKIKEFNKSLEEFKNGINEDIDTFKDTITKSINSAKESMTIDSDFVITTNNQIQLTTDIQYGRSTNRKAFNKTGYKPLGVVGYSVPYNYNEKWSISEYNMEKSENGSATVYVEGNPTTNKGNITYSTTVTVQILWVKIKREESVND